MKQNFARCSREGHFYDTYIGHEYCSTSTVQISAQNSEKVMEMGSSGASYWCSAFGAQGCGFDPRRTSTCTGGPCKKAVFSCFPTRSSGYLSILSFDGNGLLGHRLIAFLLVCGKSLAPDSNSNPFILVARDSLETQAEC